MNKKVRIDNPFFNEFVYDILHRSTWEQKRRLPPEMYKVLTSERSARIWIKRSTIEEKDTVLALLGIKYFKVYANSEATSLKELKDIIASYGLNKRVSGLNDLIKQNFFVYSDKEVISLFSLMASGCHSLTYLLNRDYNKHSYTVLKWKNNADLPSDGEIKDSVENSKKLSKFMLQTINSWINFPIGVGIDEEEMRVLLYFFPHRNSYVSKEIVENDFHGYLSKHKITKAIKKLCEVLYLETYVHKKTEYCITGRGIKIVHEYMESVFKPLSFQ